MLPRLSILDVLPVTTATSPGEALRGAGELARLGEELGYERVWYAEHHGMANIASATPELLIAHVGARTSRIRVGAGGVMLPNHVPLKVVEQYRTLNALYPGRVDLGIGRAAGTDLQTARALGTRAGRHFPAQFAELRAFAGEGAFPADHPYAALSVTPQGVPLPPVWMLGSSGGSATLAGELGLGYAFAGHFAPVPAGPAVAAYREAFRPSEAFPEPRVILALTVCCAPGEAEAVELSATMEMVFVDLALGRRGPALSPAEARARGWRPGLAARFGDLGRLMITGDPSSCREQMLQRAAEVGADELMVMCLTYEPQARLRAYRLLAEAWELAA